MQPAAETNEQEGDDTEEQEREKDPHCLHLAAGGVVQVAVQGDPFASYEHDVESNGEQGYPKSIGRIHFVVQQFGHIKEYLVVIPWKMNNK